MVYSVVSQYTAHHAKQTLRTIIPLIAMCQWSVTFAMNDKSLDLSASRPSQMGHYQVSFKSKLAPITLNTIHEWQLMVMTPQGEPVNHLDITIEGGMPMHDHGLPTAPRVTANTADGNYRVEGMKFQMGGHWTVTFNIMDPHDNSDAKDSVTFNLQL